MKKKTNPKEKKVWGEVSKPRKIKVKVEKDTEPELKYIKVEIK